MATTAHQTSVLSLSKSSTNGKPEQGELGDADRGDADRILHVGEAVGALFGPGTAAGVDRHRRDHGGDAITSVEARARPGCTRRRP